VDQGGQAGGEDDAAKLPPFPVERGAAVLSVIAIQLGQPVARLVLPKESKRVVDSLQQRLVKTGGRLVKHARYYWMMLPRPPDAAPVRKHVAADSGFAAAGRIGAQARRNQSGRRRELREGCLRNRFEIRQITAFWPGQRPRAGRGLPLNECEKVASRHSGVILSSPDKQNGNPGK